jgi:hypothetical protein
MREETLVLVGVVKVTLNSLSRRDEVGEPAELGGETSPEALVWTTSTSATWSSEEGGLEATGDFLPLFLEAETP